MRNNTNTHMIFKISKLLSMIFHNKNIVSENYKLNIFFPVSTKVTSSLSLTFPPFNTLVKIPFLGIIHSPT